MRTLKHLSEERPTFCTTKICCITSWLTRQLLLQKEARNQHET